MEKLIEFIELCLRSVKTTSDRTTRLKYYNQAFGAVQYHDFLHLTEYEELETLWNETYRPQFEELVYGV
jgi:hypothetical protein